MEDGYPDEGEQAEGISRKNLLRAAAAAPLPVVLGGAAGNAALARTRQQSSETSGQVLDPTPSCDDGDDPTPPQTEGPYFTPNSPRRSNLVEPGMPGTRLTVSGYVFDLQCQPIADVLMDFWQADYYGAYDNVGYTLRGHQFTDGQGAFNLSTIVPGLYPGRTRHIHVKVQAPNNPVLTTQLYFPGEPRNRTDRIFDPRLLMNVRQDGSGKEGTFDFVLNVTQSPNPPDPGDPPSGTWTSGTSYRPGDQVTYNGVTYECLQAHNAAAGWEPPNVPALWRPV